MIHKKSDSFRICFNVLDMLQPVKDTNLMLIFSKNIAVQIERLDCY